MTQRSNAPPRLGIGLAGLARDIDLVLCDVWGVIHNGVDHHAGAVDALRRFRSRGGTVVLITNAPAPRGQVRRRLDSLGVPRDAYDAIATSGDVTIAMIIKAGCPPLFSIGPKGEYALYREASQHGPRPARIVALEEAELAVGIGLDETGDRPEDYDVNLQALRARGIDLICANPDIVVEVGDELVYCAGAIAERYEAMGGLVLHAGKPHAPIYDMAMGLADAIRGPTRRSRILAIGDAMHTDVAGASAQGIASLMITSGIHRAALHQGGRDSAIDIEAFGRFLAGYATAPNAALPSLSW